jgi:hypothetical protein
MAVAVVHPLEQRRVLATRLIERCALFRNNLALLGAPYAVRALVSVEVFREFVSALDGGAVEITGASFAGLALLCAEFGFEAMAARLSELRSPAAAEARIAPLEAPAVEESAQFPGEEIRAEA